MRLLLKAAVVFAFVSTCTLVHATLVMIPGVPAYDWYHGCAPTAAASIFGFWDLNGYSNLFDASGADVYLTANVGDHISSPEHNQKYDPTPDNTALPDPPDTSIADFFHTSEDPLNYGWSYVHYSDDAFIGYAGYRGYTFNSFYSRYTTFGWAQFTSEIDAGRPLMFAVDVGGDGLTDHSVPVFGYDQRAADDLWYAFYTTWSESETVQWREFRPMSLGNAWGVGYATFVQPDEQTPEPASVLLVASGLFCVALWRRKSGHHA